MSLGSGIRDPGSGINLFRIPDPGVKKAPDPGSRNTDYSRSKDPDPDPKEIFTELQRGCELILTPFNCATLSPTDIRRTGCYGNDIK
jgi:hypothetical protein